MKNTKHYRKNDANAGRFRPGRELLRIATTAGWHIAPRLVTDYLKVHFFTPPKFPLNEKQQRLLDISEKFSFSVNGKTVRGWKWGSGPAVLLIHGWGGSAFQFSEFIEPVAASGHTAVTWDNPAHGFSEGATSNFMEFVATFRSALGIFPEPAAVIAHSMGVGVSMNIGRTAKPGFKFIFLAPNYELKEEFLKYFDHVGIYRKIFLEALREIEEEHSVRFDDLAPQATVQYCGSPALIFHDDNDRVTPFSQSEMLAEQLANARLVKTTGLGHGKILYDPSVVEESVRFLRNGSG